MATTTLRREQPLFETSLPVRFFSSHDDPEDLFLTVRVISGTRFLGAGQSQRLLHLEFTNPEDLAFLYTLQIAEDDYHDLKQDQSLRIDFAGFADNLIPLLKSCERSTRDCRFTAIIRHAAGSTFEVVEATQFKNLTHICLRIQPGNDDAIKAYLAARLELANTRIELLERNGEESREETAELKVRFERQGQELAELKRVQESLIRDMELKHAAEIASIREAAVEAAEKQQRDTSNRLEEQRRTAEEKGASTAQLLKETQDELKQVSAAKFEAEIQNGRLTSELEALRADIAHVKAECAAEKAAREQLTRGKHEAEKQLGEAQSQVIALRQQVADKSETLTQMNVVVEGLRAERSTCEESLRMFKDSNVRLQGQMDTSIAEINKGNTVISKLQRDKKAFRAKIKLQEAVVQQQEKRIVEYEQRIASDRQHLRELQSKVEELNISSADISKDRDRFKTELLNASKVIEDNKQCILYLNRELDSHKARTIMGSPPGQGGGLELVAGTGSTYRDFNDSYGTTTGYQGTNATGGDNDIYSFEGRFDHASQHSNSSDSQPNGTGAGGASFAVDGHTSRAMGAFGESTDIYNNGVY